MSLTKFPLFFLFSITLTTSSFSYQNDDVLIRQVVQQDHILNADHHFNLFKEHFSKAYVSKEEHDYRLGVFKANMRRALRHQKLDPSAVHGVTQFSDFTPAEFRRRFLGLNGGRRSLRVPEDANQAPILPTDDVPEEFDWREHGAVTNVKNQVIVLIER
ncbi:cysteine protease [Lithospermum erythrorhizon]|uniref:Cysteine protease n=1 Tax=Lithospermum erythrorhizon TaxID=34254 RepID=A0AAV3QT22_LITER